MKNMKTWEKIAIPIIVLITVLVSIPAIYWLLGRTKVVREPVNHVWIEFLDKNNNVIGSTGELNIFPFTVFKVGSLTGVYGIRLHARVWVEGASETWYLDIIPETNSRTINKNFYQWKSCLTAGTECSGCSYDKCLAGTDNLYGTTCCAKTPLGLGNTATYDVGFKLEDIYYGLSGDATRTLSIKFKVDGYVCADADYPCTSGKYVYMNSWESPTLTLSITLASGQVTGNVTWDTWSILPYLWIGK
jgi:hypothetical protein